MSHIEQLITTTTKDGGSADQAGALIGQFDIWSSAIKKRGAQGRGSSKKIELQCTGIVNNPAKRGLGRNEVKVGDKVGFIARDMTARSCLRVGLC